MKRISAHNLCKAYKIKRRKSTALSKLSFYSSGSKTEEKIKVLKGVSFEINSGEIVGILGGNGTGKTTLLRLIAGIIFPDSGRVSTNGNIIPLINLRLGLQDKLTTVENVYLCCSFLGLSKNKIDEKLESIISFANLNQFADAKTYQLSLGMRQRLVFSIAMHSRPDILLLDEVFEVGDEKFRTKSVKEIIKLSQEGSAVVLVSNELDIIKKYCTRALWIDGGVCQLDGRPEEVVTKYLDKS